jgi:hypothetical protein
MNHLNWEGRVHRSGMLLQNIKATLADVDELRERFDLIEPDAVYRFYHYSSKVFHSTQPLIRAALALFERLSPEGIPLNEWFMKIAQSALA